MNSIILKSYFELLHESICEGFSESGTVSSFEEQFIV